MHITTPPYASTRKTGDFPPLFPVLSCSSRTRVVFHHYVVQSFPSPLSLRLNSRPSGGLESFLPLLPREVLGAVSKAAILSSPCPPFRFFSSSEAGQRLHPWPLTILSRPPLCHLLTTVSAATYGIIEFKSPEAMLFNFPFRSVHAPPRLLQMI